MPWKAELADHSDDAQQREHHLYDHQSMCFVSHLLRVFIDPAIQFAFVWLVPEQNYANCVKERYPHEAERDFVPDASHLGPVHKFSNKGRGECGREGDHESRVRDRMA